MKSQLLVDAVIVQLNFGAGNFTSFPTLQELGS